MNLNLIIILTFLVMIIIAIIIGLIFGIKTDSSSKKVLPRPDNANWVAVGNGELDYQNIMYSDNGRDWFYGSQEGSSFSYTGYGIAYGLSEYSTIPLWVAAGDGTVNTPGNHNLMYSYDGISWKFSSVNGNIFRAGATSVAFGLSSNGTSFLWTATGNGAPSIDNQKLMYSYNGIEWNYSSENSSVFTVRSSKTAYGLSSNEDAIQWVAAGEGSNNNEHLMYSHDGICWIYSSASGASFASRAYSVEYGLSTNGTSPMWVAAGSGTSYTPGNEHLMYSYNGREWKYSSPEGASFSGLGIDVAYGTSSNEVDGMWVAVGYNDTTEYHRNIMYSYNGISWKYSDPLGEAFRNRGIGIKYGLSSNGTSPLWVAVGNNDGTNNSRNILYSNDGIYWRKSTNDTFYTNGYEVAYKGFNVALGASFPFENGFPEPPAPPPSPEIQADWVAVGLNTDYPNLLYSTNGLCWAFVNNNSDDKIFESQGWGVAYGLSANGISPMWVAAGQGTNYNEHLLYSHNGLSWNFSAADGSIEQFQYAYGVAYGLSSNKSDGWWVAVGDAPGGDSNLLYSKNGISWQYGSGISFTHQGESVAYGLSANGTSPMWVAVGRNDNFDNGNIIYSYDGLCWVPSDANGASFQANAYNVAFGLSTNGTSPMWVAVGGTNISGSETITDLYNNILYSNNGITWEQSDPSGVSLRGDSGVSFAYDVAYGLSNGFPFWVAVGGSNSVGNRNILYSYNGKKWEYSDSSNEEFYQYAYGVASNVFNPALGDNWPN